MGPIRDIDLVVGPKLVGVDKDGGSTVGVGTIISVGVVAGTGAFLFQNCS